MFEYWKTVKYYRKINYIYQIVYVVNNCSCVSMSKASSWGNARWQLNVMIHCQNEIISISGEKKTTFNATL